MCASCKARLIEGQVEMDRNWALVDSEVEAGYILTCQAHPLTETVSVDYDV
jgi:ring-1,2-phenylacetyl-CoA epoxidase subunit PaaE